MTRLFSCLAAMLAFSFAATAAEPKLVVTTDPLRAGKRHGGTRRCRADGGKTRCRPHRHSLENREGGFQVIETTSRQRLSGPSS
jgi:hypothetical protein